MTAEEKVGGVPLRRARALGEHGAQWDVDWMPISMDQWHSLVQTGSCYGEVASRGVSRRSSPVAYQITDLVWFRQRIDVRPFKFFNMWTEDFQGIVADAWAAQVQRR